MKRNGPRFGGLERFGVTLKQLSKLGQRRVTFELTIGVPPYVYPSRARLQRLLRESPKRRRALVHAWRTKEYDRLKAELSFVTGGWERIEFNGDPVGMVVSAPAATASRLSRLAHAGSVKVRGIQGRKPKPQTPGGIRLFAVKVRFVEEVEGQHAGLQEVEERIIVVAARSPADAQRQVRRVCAKDEGVILLTSGHFRTRSFEKVLGVCEAPDPVFSPAGTEVYYELRKRRLARRETAARGSRLAGTNEPPNARLQRPVRSAARR